MESNAYNMVHVAVCEYMSRKDRIHKREVRSNEKIPNKVMADMIRKSLPTILNVKWDDIQGKCREAWIIVPRQMYCYFMSKYGNVTAKNIGKELDRDHTTILSAIKRVSDMLHCEDDVYTDAHSKVLKFINP